MRVRIKFSKQKPMQYIGHLDTMRYFQKVLRRAELPVAFSGGFSPHILMSFASPLGVGKTSTGEYFDLDLQERVPCEEIVLRMKAQLSEGFDVTAVSEIEESKRTNGMRVIAAASYRVILSPDVTVSEERVRAFLAQDKIEIVRRTKHKEELTDIRPWIYALHGEENELSMLLSAGSVQNLKPEPVVYAYAAMQGIDPDAFSMDICRTELYAEDPDGREQADRPLLFPEDPKDKVHAFQPLLYCGCPDRAGVYIA